jgi:hypothetical protein
VRMLDVLLRVKDSASRLALYQVSATIERKILRVRGDIGNTMSPCRGMVIAPRLPDGVRKEMVVGSG